MADPRRHAGLVLASVLLLSQALRSSQACRLYVDAATADAAAPVLAPTPDVIAACTARGVGFQSQYQQDSIVVEYVQEHGAKVAPTFVDLAANAPKVISNTFFFEQCLGWTGLCIEPNNNYWKDLYEQRTCDVVPLCVSDRVETISFIEGGPLGGIAHTNKNLHVIDDTRSDKDAMRSWRSRAASLSTRRTCVPLSFLLDRFDLQHIGMLSLDVEGHELQVLRGIDWNRTKIDIVAMESNDEAAMKELRAAGFKHYRSEIYVHDSLPL